MDQVGRTLFCHQVPVALIFTSRFNGSRAGDCGTLVISSTYARKAYYPHSNAAFPPDLLPSDVFFSDDNAFETGDGSAQITSATILTVD